MTHAAELDLNTIQVPLSWSEVFGRTAPLHLEIGSGKGRFLLELAADHPEWDLLAVERANKYHTLVCSRVARRGLSNVRLLRTTAEDLLHRLLPAASVDTLYVLFPDPWPKKRHHKRRLFNPETSRARVRALRPGGRLMVKSDHMGYAEVIDEVLRATPGLRMVDPDEAFRELPLTGFETKYLEQGRAIRAFAAITDGA
jgi:tRNA (guanine-N7-)-methyltransferase